jgi:hypothetical protein
VKSGAASAQVHCAGHATHQLGVRGAGDERVDPDVVLEVVECRAVDHADDAVLGRRLALGGGQRVRRGGDHHAAAAPGLQVRDLRRRGGAQ